MSAEQETKMDLIELTSQLVSAYVGHNALNVADLPKLLSDVYRVLKGLASKGEPVAEPEQQPAVSIRKSVTPDFLICLDDGKKFKSLKRHLAQLGMTPDEYRAKWNLPRDYPMVAPNYAAVRSQLARANGLGRKPGQPAPAQAPARKRRKVAATA